MRIRGALMGVLLLSVSAGAAWGQAKQPAKKPKTDRNVITLAELDASGAKSVMQAIRKLRPFWLSSRGATTLRMESAGDVTAVTKESAMGVYVDGVRRGELPELDLVALEQVGEMRYYSVEAAVTKFGSGNPLGAIEIISRK